LTNIQKRIFRNIQHEPRIWGITFGHVFGTLILALVLTLICQSLEAGGLVTATAGGGCAVACYGLAFWWDNRTPTADLAPDIKPRQTCLCLSNQGYVIRTALGGKHPKEGR